MVLVAVVVIMTVVIMIVVVIEPEPEAILPELILAVEQFLNIAIIHFDCFLIVPDCFRFPCSAGRRIPTTSKLSSLHR